VSRRKDYDDERLVELLARGTKRHDEIAAELGISKGLVSEISRGRIRPELQGRISAARDTYKVEIKRQAKVWARDDLRAGLTDRKNSRRKNYDEDLLVELIAADELNYSQIARRVGVSSTTVQRIAIGVRRPDLQSRIHDLVRARQRAARRQGVRWLKALIQRHVHDGLTGEDDLARRCREFAIDRFLGDDSETVTVTVTGVRAGLSDLPEPLREQVLRALGGPVSEDPGQ